MNDKKISPFYMSGAAIFEKKIARQFELENITFGFFDQKHPRKVLLHKILMSVMSKKEIHFERKMVDISKSGRHFEFENMVFLTRKNPRKLLLH